MSILNPDFHHGLLVSYGVSVTACGAAEYASIGGHEQMRCRSTVRIVDARNGWPELVRSNEREREHRFLSRVRVRPTGGRDLISGVGRVLEDVVVGIRCAIDQPACTSRRMAIIASQNRSSSSRGSLSVGSTISVPGTGNDTVGAWKP